MPQPLPPAVRDEMSQVASSAVFGGILLTVFGAYYWWAELTGISDSGLYNASVTMMVWVPLISGPLMLVVAAMLFAGVRAALLIEAILTLAVGGLLLLIGLVRVGYHFPAGSFDLQGILLLIFGGMFLRSGMGSRRVYAEAACAGQSALAGGSGHPPEAGGPVPPSGGLKEEARERLLRAKRNLQAPAGDAAPVETGGPAQATAATIPGTAESDRADEPVAVPDGQPRPDYGRFGDTDLTFLKVEGRRDDPPVSGSEPPETGFLAELGREDDERK
jgi:hypothetical protein